MRSLAALSAAAMAMGLLAAPEARAQIGIGWREDERVLVFDASAATALARSPAYLFVATRGGLLAWDDAFGRFELPLTAEDGYPASPVTAMTWDPRDGHVWLAAVQELVQVDPRSRRFVDRFPIRDPILELVPAEPGTSEFLARTARGWRRIDTFSRAERPATPAEAAAAIDRSPDLRARRELLQDPSFGDMIPFLTRPPGRPAIRITDVMPAFQADQFWLATDGAFLLRYDHGLRDWSPLVWGFVGEGAAAVLEGPEGLWFIPRGPAIGRMGVARADRELQHWEIWETGPVIGAPSGGVRAALTVASTVWVGGEGGLFRFRQGDGWQQVRDVLPGGSGDVLSLARDPSGAEEGAIWVGTARGLFRLQGEGPLLGLSLLPSARVLALTAGADRLWIGTSAGLYTLAIETGNGAVEVRPVSGAPVLSRPAGALAESGDTIFVGLGDEVWSRTDSVGWHRVDAFGRMGGAVTSLAVRDGLVWAGSEAEAVAWDASRGWTERVSFAAGDLPVDPTGRRGVWAILPTGPREAWLATPVGALRLQLRR